MTDSPPSALWAADYLLESPRANMVPLSHEVKPCREDTFDHSFSVIHYRAHSPELFVAKGFGKGHWNLDAAFFVNMTKGHLGH